MEHIVFVEAPTTGAGLKGVKICKKNNILVSFITRNKEKYIKSGILDYVDNLIIGETNTIEDTLELVEKLNNEITITSIMTFADFYVPQVAYVAEKLKLPCMSYKSAMNCRNKYFMRKIIEEKAKQFNPKFFLVNNLEECLEKASEIKYPLIMKPQDENDSYNVVLINNENELCKNFSMITINSLNRAGQKKESKALLLEEYLPSQEYSVETYSTDISIDLIGITKKITTGKERGCFVEIAHIFPVEEHQHLIFSAVKRVLEALEIKNAICHTEVKIENGEVKIIEVNPRLAGGGIGSDMIEVSTGINAVEYAIDLARGITHSIVKKKNNCSVIYKIQALKEGVLKNIKFSNEIDNDKRIVKKDIFISFGENVRPPRLNADLIGYILVEGFEEKETFSYAKDIVERIEVVIE